VEVIVVDSDVLIDALRGRSDVSERIASELRKGTLSTTVINAFELLSGARKKREKSKVETLLAAMTILPLSDHAARRAAALRVDLETHGKGIGMADYLIAGICLESSSSLLTRNVSHFKRVQGLKLVKL
jgi:predicted nucleic acid-binding protein